MKYYIFLIVITLLLGACSSDSSNGPSNEYTDQELLDKAWEYYGNRDYVNAEEFFNKLIDREVMLAEANCGLGWVYSKTGELNSAIEKLDLALTLEPNSQTLSDIYAAKAIAYDALDMHNECLDAAANIENTWVFSQNSYINFDDIVILKAISYYALADFVNSLIQVQILSPSFDADVNTSEGITQLADKIEELQN